MSSKKRSTRWNVSVRKHVAHSEGEYYVWEVLHTFTDKEIAIEDALELLKHWKKVRVFTEDNVRDMITMTRGLDT